MSFLSGYVLGRSLSKTHRRSYYDRDYKKELLEVKCQELENQVKSLQEQLNDANSALKYFADSKIGAEQEDGRYICGMAGFDGMKGQVIYYDPRPAKKYFEKWGTK